MITPSLVSISEAARRAGKSRVTLHRMIDKGSISKEIGEDGKPAIRLDELARVFPRADLSPSGGKIQLDQVDTVTEHVSGVQAQIAMLQDALNDARQQRDRAQEALDQERKERLRQAERLDDLLEVQTRLLTDQRPRKGSFWSFGKS